MPAGDQRAVYQSGDCELDLARRELRARGTPIPIGARAFGIIEILVRSAGELVSKDDLMDRVWPGAIVGDNTLQVHISAVRKALGPYRSMLKTESGRGYRLLGSWTPRHQNTSSAIAQLEPVRAPAPPSRTNFPAAAADLIGRNAAVQHLRDLLSAYRVVTLTGPGGIGKTTLALEVARNLFPDFGGEGRLAELASLADPDLVPFAVAGVLDIKLHGGEMSPEAVARAIGEKRLLLVLDNCEHVIDAAATLAETIVHLCPQTTILATSREVLRIEGEYVYRVPPLDVPDRDHKEPGDVLARSAVQLFIARTRASDSTPLGQAENLPAIAAICRHLDGIPLAIEFAAARAAALGIEQVVSGLEDRFRLLTSGRRTALPRHQTLRATLDWSYDLLLDAEAALLRRLAIFAGDFSLDAAIVVADDLAALEVVDHLSNLVAKSLIVAEHRDQVRQYRLLDTTRVYALEKLRTGGEFPRAARRHAEYFRDFFAQTEADSGSRGQADWLAIHTRHGDNLRAGLDWAFSTEGDAQLGVALTVAAIPLWDQLSRMDECRERVERALASLDADDAATERWRMQLLAARGWSLMYGVGRAREAGPTWAATLALAERLDNTEYRLRALWGLCIDQFNNGEIRAALEFAQRFAALVANSTDPVDLIMGDRILATSLHYLGDQNAARLHIDRVLARLAHVGQQPQVARLRFDMRVSTHYFQARILWLQGFADQARRIVEHNIEEGRALGHALTFCSVLGQGACPIAFLASDIDTAARYGAMLLEHTERYPVRLWRLWAGCFDGMVKMKRGEIVAGLDILRRGLEQAGDARFLPRFLMPLGELAAGLGEVGEIARGLATVDETLARCEPRHERWYVAELIRIRGELLLRLGGARSISAAEECFRSALDLAGQQGALFWELRSALSLARLRVAQDRHAEARQVLPPVCDRFTEGSAIADMRAARDLLASLDQAGGG